MGRGFGGLGRPWDGRSAGWPGRAWTVAQSDELLARVLRQIWCCRYTVTVGWSSREASPTTAADVQVFIDGPNLLHPAPCPAGRYSDSAPVGRPT
jgi:hypothetical protein